MPASAHFLITGFALVILGLALVRGAGEARVRLLFAAGIFLLGLETVMAGFLSREGEPVGHWLEWNALLKAVIPAVWLAFSVTYSRGNFRRFTRRWLPLIAVSLLFPLTSLFLFPEALWIEISGVPAAWEYSIGFAGFILHGSALMASALVLINLERTFRAAVGTMRWRIKFIILGVAVLFTARLYTSSQALLFHSYSSSLQIIESISLGIACILFARGLFRSGTFSLDLYPSERVLQYSLAGVLIGAYLLFVGLLSKLLARWSPDSALPLQSLFLLFAFVALATLLLSERLRDISRRFISRHFHRPIYDYRTVWLGFTEKTASILDAAELSRVLVEWISQNLNVLSASAWLADEDHSRLQLAASTGLTQNRAPDLPHAEAHAIIQGLRAQSAPFILDDRADAWAAPLKACYPDMFPHGGKRVAVPLISNARLIGFLTLGDRVNGVPYGPQEFDLLKCVADQVAASLQNLQLSQRLLQTKEMEAFQTIAAFFVHDLKNTASGLNLTLQNLPKYWDNPEFRQDALKTISRSVHHIQELIQRLTLFRQKLDLHPAQTDLNAVIQSALNGLGDATGIHQNLTDLAPIIADAEQLEKVFTNLFLNAREASLQNGQARIEVDTAQQNGWVIATVRDTGCGMTPEFIARNLFRPFQTTKKGGIGIGMFQSKAIIEAHRGKIEVESTPAEGTTFRISLPAK